tara:strand:- start:1062 stop:2198 length:1137 start_codon:yes stop_codon:yes gene_type:complete
MNKSKIVLIGNYPLDHQESMQRFANMLKIGFEDIFEVEIYFPKVLAARLFNHSLSGIAKYLGYIDKWILFPIFLKRKVRKNDKKTYFHVCDHSNAYYMRSLPDERSSITCHDVLAIRGALGYKDAYCPASRSGVVFQKWILKHLIKTEKIACVSQFTLKQLVALNGDYKKSGWKVIYNGFNAPFRKLSSKESEKRLKKKGLELLVSNEYFIHLGSNLSRKNKILLLKTLKYLPDWKGKICFAGKPLDDNIKEMIQDLGIQNRVVEVVKPEFELLEALINYAKVFVFPSFSEGFGWPVTEAQACGTPVVASNFAPMPEVGGEGALYADPYSPEEFAEQIKRILINPTLEAQLVTSGFENVKRFETTLMIERYKEFFKHG